MSQPAIFPYISTLGEYYNLTVREACRKFAEDNPSAIEVEKLTMPKPLGIKGYKFEGRQVGKVSSYIIESPIRYLSIHHLNIQFTEAERECVINLVNIMIDDDEDLNIRFAANVIIHKIKSLKLELLR